MGRLWARSERVHDLAPALLVTGVAIGVLVHDRGGAGGLPFLVALVSGAALVARRRRPTIVLAVVVLGRLVVTWQTDNEFALTPAAAVALYTVARHGERKSGLITAAVAALVMGLVSAAVSDESFAVELLGEGAVALLPVAVGDATRTRADRLRDLIDTEAEARVQAERLRIARDLHDVVAHGLSTIAIQSGVAAHLLDTDPSQARESLEIINSTGKASLEELRAMVGVLRSTDGASLRPAPTDPDDLDDLILSAGNAGVPVSVEQSGAFPEDTPDAVVVAVHRIVQEALTNVIRHAGPAPTTLCLSHHADNVLVEVRNEPTPGAPVPVSSTGVGIIGMRERAESVGGRLEAETDPDGGFTVRATIPYHRGR